MNILYVVLILGSFGNIIEASGALEMYTPRISKVGQCGEDTVLKFAAYGGDLGVWRWFIGGRFSISGKYNETVHKGNKYTAYVENEILTLIIHNTSSSSKPQYYNCATRTIRSTWIYLPIECVESGRYTPRISKGGQCGEDTVLTCVTSDDEYWQWEIGGRMSIDERYRETVHKENKYTAYVEKDTLTLVIHNTNATDQQYYGCYINRASMYWIYLPVECKASSAEFVLKDDKKLEIVVDKLHPEEANMTVTLDTEGGLSTVHGERSCERSSKYEEYFKCIWYSSNSMQDGYLNVSVVVTTLTEAKPLSETILIATPDSPKIENVYKIQGGTEVVVGAISNNLTITCTSEGGSPRQTVVLYIDTVSTNNELATSSHDDFMMKNDDTHSVTIKYTFLNTQMSLHGRKLVCRSYYPKADNGFQGSKIRSVEIYLIGNFATEGVSELPLIPTIGGCVGGLSIIIVIALVVVVFAYRRMCCFSCRRDGTANQQEEFVLTTTMAAENQNVPRESVIYEIPDSNPEHIPIDIEYEDLGERDASTTYNMLDSGTKAVCTVKTSSRH